MLDLVPRKRKENLCGVGILDADYQVTPVSGLRCPFHAAWSGMINRCFSEAALKREPSYRGCSVSTGWQRFSVFKRWMEKQEWQGNHLDKDIIMPGNRIYHPDYCAFVTPRTNLFIHGKEQKLGPFPRGIHFDGRKFKAQLASGKGTICLGSFDTAKEASEVYLDAKLGIYEQILEEQSDERVVKGLALHAAKLIESHELYFKELVVKSA